ncbi:hypothetical protein BDW60DRAFT_208467 [Aspergillus nidulans var. acristatus]
MTGLRRQSALVASPFRSLPVLNASGTVAMYTQHVPATGHEQTSALQRAIWVLDLNSVRSWPIPDTHSARNPQWLGHGDQVIWLEACTNGHTRFVVADGRLRGDRYVAGSVAGPVWDLRTTGVVNMADPGDDTDDDLGFFVVGQVDEGGRLFNPFQDQSPEVGGGLTRVHFRGRSQDSPEGNGQPRTVIWFGSLVRPLTQRDALSGRYTIPRVTNLMAYFNLGNVSVNSMPNENS